MNNISRRTGTGYENAGGRPRKLADLPLRCPPSEKGMVSRVPILFLRSKMWMLSLSLGCHPTPNGFKIPTRLGINSLPHGTGQGAGRAAEPL